MGIAGGCGGESRGRAGLVKSGEVISQPRKRDRYPLWGPTDCSLVRGRAAQRKKKQAGAKIKRENRVCPESDSFASFSRKGQEISPNPLMKIITDMVPERWKKSSPWFAQGASEISPPFNIKHSRETPTGSRITNFGKKKKQGANRRGNRPEVSRPNAQWTSFGSIEYFKGGENT